MAEAIVDLIDRPERAAAVAQAGRALVERRYGWEERLRPLAAMLRGDRPDPAPEQAG